MRNARYRTPRRRTRAGESLTEILTALFILGLVLVPIFQAQSSGIMGVDGLRRLDACQYGVQWWLAHLPTPVTPASLEAMPETTPDGDVRFSWETQPGENGALVVTLTARDRGSDAPFVLSRIFSRSREP